MRDERLTSRHRNSINSAREYIIEMRTMAALPDVYAASPLSSLVCFSSLRGVVFMLIRIGLAAKTAARIGNVSG